MKMSTEQAQYLAAVAIYDGCTGEESNFDQVCDAMHAAQVALVKWAAGELQRHFPNRYAEVAFLFDRFHGNKLSLRYVTRLTDICLRYRPEAA